MFEEIENVSGEPNIVGGGHNMSGIEKPEIEREKERVTEKILFLWFYFWIEVGFEFDSLPTSSFSLSPSWIESNHSSVSLSVLFFSASLYFSEKNEKKEREWVRRREKEISSLTIFIQRKFDSTKRLIK